MTLTINPASTLRPLGEEHLRMFRRTVGSTPKDSPKLILPEEAASADVLLSESKVNAYQAKPIAEFHKGRLASIVEIIADKRLLEELDGKKAFVSNTWGAAGEATYLVETKPVSFTRLSDDEAEFYYNNESVTLLTVHSIEKNPDYPLGLRVRKAQEGVYMLVLSGGQAEAQETGFVAFTKKK